MPSTALLRSITWRSLLCASFVALAGVTLGGCQSAMLGGGAQADNLITGSTSVVSLKETSLAGKRWESNPGDMRAGLEYASLLKRMGQNEKSLQVIHQLMQTHPKDAALVTLYGKMLAEAGRGAEAVEVLNRVIATGQADWKVYSALGSARDQQGQFSEAREAYGNALALEPDEPSILNNLGLSYVLEGNLKKAEDTLKQAAATPRGSRDPRLRQNLALAVGLQGRFDEAREIASRDLPQQQVEANVAYLQTMLSQPNTWQQLQTARTGG
jgi:Flp pilus assembly protein TadD